MRHTSNLMKSVKFKRCRVLAFLLVLLIMFSQVRVVLADPGESTTVMLYTDELAEKLGWTIENNDLMKYSRVPLSNLAVEAGTSPSTYIHDTDGIVEFVDVYLNIPVPGPSIITINTVAQYGGTSYYQLAGVSSSGYITKYIYIGEATNLKLTMSSKVAVKEISVQPIRRITETPTETEYKHTHEYEWVTVREATEDMDAEEVYRCKSCGDIKYRMQVPNSAYAQFNQNAITSIDRASLGAEVKIKTNLWVSFRSEVIETLKERTDVSVTIDYLYQGIWYTVTIPAGADLDALEESEGYYGFRYLDQVFEGSRIN